MTVKTFTRTKYAELEIKTVPSDGRGTWTGLASTFDETPDKQGDVIVFGAFAKSIAEWRSRRQMPPVLWGHDLSDPVNLVGKLTSMQETKQGLLVSGRLDLKSERALVVYEKMLSGDLDSMSIGYQVFAEHKRADGVNVLTEVDLIEVSLTPVPANPNARILAVKSADNPFLPAHDRGHSPKIPHDSARDRMWKAAGVDPEIKRYDERLAALEAPLEKAEEGLVERFIREDREERVREAAEAARLREVGSDNAIRAHNLIDDDPERDRERFAREQAFREKQDELKAREAEVRAQVDVARRAVHR